MRQVMIVGTLLGIRNKIWIWLSVDGDGQVMELWCVDDKHIRRCRPSPREMLLPRLSAAYATWNDRMFVCGGQKLGEPKGPTTSDQSGRRVYTYITPVTTLADVYASYDGENWERICDAAEWGEREAHACAAHKECLWLSGGSDIGMGRERADVWKSSDGARWTVVNEECSWAPRYHHQMISFLGQMWIIGGHCLRQVASEGDTQRFTWSSLGDVWRSHNGHDWSCVSDTAPWGPRGNHSCFVGRGKLYLCGGAMWNVTDKQFVACGDVWSTSDGVSWNKEADIPHLQEMTDASIVLSGDLFHLIRSEDREHDHIRVSKSADLKTWENIPLELA